MVEVRSSSSKQVNSVALCLKGKGYKIFKVRIILKWLKLNNPCSYVRLIPVQKFNLDIYVLLIFVNIMRKINYQKNNPGNSLVWSAGVASVTATLIL